MIYHKIFEPFTLGPDIVESGGGQETVNVEDGEAGLLDWFYSLELGDDDQSSVESLARKNPHSYLLGKVGRRTIARRRRRREWKAIASSH